MFTNNGEPNSGQFAERVFNPPIIPKVPFDTKKIIKRAEGVGVNFLVDMAYLAVDPRLRVKK